MTTDYTKYQGLSFAKFRKLAQDPSLSEYEKIGFPESYRRGMEKSILADIRKKIPALDTAGTTLLEIGPGISPLPRLLIAHCVRKRQSLTLVDGPEILAQLPNARNVRKVPGQFPSDLRLWIKETIGLLDGILCYSVLHYIFSEDNAYDFIDSAVSLLAPGGSLLLGDIPNVDRRKRFFTSEQGIAFHKRFMGTTEPPLVRLGALEPGQIDDAFLISIFLRYRRAGYEVQILDQARSLPMANRREDILIRRY